MLTTNANSDHIKQHAIIEREQPAPAMRQYSRDDLLDALESEKHPAIRRIMGEMLYTMGARDQVAS